MTAKAQKTASKAKAEAPRKAPQPRTIGGMVETTWAGNKMWKCPKCNGTTFIEVHARVHECKESCFADDSFFDVEE